MEEVKKVYPTDPDADGWFYEKEDEEESEVLTKKYDNESRIKKVLTSKGWAVVRELRGKDFSVIQSIVSGGQITFEAATMSLSTKIDDKGYPPEFYMDDLKLIDFSKILIPVGRLNFS